MVKKIFLFLMTVLLVLVIWQHELLWYGIKQGQGQIKIVKNSVKISSILQDPSFPDSLKNKMLIIKKAKEFASKELGLHDTENYSTYFDQKGKSILWNVSACRPFSFEAKTWWFPIVGEVPYMGFFNEEKARKIEGELMDQGWDARVRSVSGWSTLGWFKDPILSSMLDRSEGQLAELIIHELTHGTIFLKDQVEFNENLASFIGVQGAIQYLTMNHGVDSEQLKNYLYNKEDYRKFTEHILAGTNGLDSLYDSFSVELNEEQKLFQKEKLITEICNRIDTISFSNNRYDDIFRERKPNNAYFMSFLRYYSTGDSLMSVWKNQYDSDLKEMINDYVENHAS